ncbi:MAG TPA: imidazole glycerol phosphate synthase subunit HisF [Gemmatimonadales bacterium]|nr:imidazole glycerol phosphate synthase subunit HisF [Gemmatimonadales bacterium]
MRRVIPCLDTRDGRVVKGVRFRELRDAGSPVTLAARYADEGADEIVLLDVAATPDGRSHALATVRAVRRVLPIPLTVGGGVRSVADAEALLDAGADKVGVNSAAVERPELLTELADRFGRQCITLAVDARRGPGGWEVVTRSGAAPTARDVVAWAAEGSRLGAGEILLSSIDQDGTRDGYDLALLGAVTARVAVPVIASGGGATVAHLQAALAAGADAVLAASMFHDGDLTVAQVKQALAAAGVEVRT